MATPAEKDELHTALQLAGPMQLCVGMVLVLAQEIEKHGRIVLTADADSIGSQFVEMARHLRGVQ